MALKISEQAEHVGSDSVEILGSIRVDIVDIDIWLLQKRKMSPNCPNGRLRLHGLEVKQFEVFSTRSYVISANLLVPCTKCSGDPVVVL